MKNLLLIISTLMMAAPAMAARPLQVSLNAPAVTPLTSCQGSITAKGGFMGKGKSNQIHLHVENSQYCDLLTIYATGKTYRLGTSGYGRGGDYTIPTGDLSYGWNKVQFTMSSTFTKARNDGSVFVNVVGGPTSCLGEAQWNAMQRDLDFTSVSFARVSRKGNLVFNIAGQGQVVMNSACQVVGE